MLRDQVLFVGGRKERAPQSFGGYQAGKRADTVMVCQIKFMEGTRNDRLRQPVFLKIREDKNATETVRERASLL